MADTACAGNIASKLNADQIQELKSGQIVFLTTDTPDSPWPKVHAYRLIDAAPEDVAAVFFAYESAPKFIPHLKSAIVSKKLSSCHMEIDYVLEVPIIRDEHYKTRNILTMNDQGGYRVDWILLEAMRTKSSVGHMEVEPFEGGKALMAYCTATVPGSSIAILLKKTAMNQVKETVECIAKEVEKQKEHSPQLLAKEVTDMQSALTTQPAQPPAITKIQ